MAPGLAVQPVNLELGHSCAHERRGEAARRFVLGHDRADSEMGWQTVARPAPSSWHLSDCPGREAAPLIWHRLPGQLTPAWVTPSLYPEDLAADIPQRPGWPGPDAARRKRWMP
jgi:hypothetical protein